MTFCLESTEGLLSSLSVNSSLVSNNIEFNSLTQGTALSNGNNITLLDVEGWGAMGRNILVPLLKTPVLGNVVKVIPTDHNGSLHLGGDDESLEDTSTDGYVSSEGALLVNVCSLNGSVGGLNSKADGAGVTHGLLTLASYDALAGNEDGILALVGLFVLIALLVFSGKTRHCCFFNYLQKWNPESCNGRSAWIDG
eukprot:CAMPEP_0204647880 /NCGR_PEP_ID=MMETSP0718-20130828/6838_1 /ASSEMBLY_ACC=CAM_ASM_000674 /TAXON_ID=230516 /ORGANISM="Chaetoceros curvisetus" /LENGTH=195 /DNA_ID=CAMNT_0051670563 /DNA_START=68 /DNA_END=655 /DNA_ORIENTATION=-